MYCLIIQKGQPPCEIISPRLDIGGRLNKNASNGNTNVTINDRVITKKELRMLKVFVLYNAPFFSPSS
jgi:hypothetical protein